MDVDILQKVVGRAFDPTLTLIANDAEYKGSVIPLSGKAAVEITIAGITAAIVDDTGWQQRAWQELPAGTIGNPGLVFRKIESGKLGKPEEEGTITTGAGWSAEGVLFFGHNYHFDRGHTEYTYRFRVRIVRIDGSAAGLPIVASRVIYRRGAFSAAGDVDGHAVIARPLATKSATIEGEFMSVTFDFVPDDLTLDAVWNVVNFLAGNTLQMLATEHLSASGEIVYTEHRVGIDSRDTRQTFFHRIFPSYGQLAPDGFVTLILGIRHLLSKGFPIEVVLHHLHLSLGETMDVEAQHLTLAIHTAIEAWTRFFGREEWMAKKQWESISKRLRQPMKELQLFKELAEELKRNVRSAMVHANATTTAWRQAFFFDSLNIDVSDENSKRALKTRDELLHNGHFLRRSRDLTHDEQQGRVDDIARLRRLTLLICFKLVGYTGDFTNPLTFLKDSVDSSEIEFPNTLRK